MIEVAQDFENIFTDFKYEAARISGGLKKSLSQSILNGNREIVNCFVMLFKLQADICEARSGKPSTSVSGTSAAAAVAAQSKSAGLSSKEFPQWIEVFVGYGVLIKIFVFSVNILVCFVFNVSR